MNIATAQRMTVQQGGLCDCKCRAASKGRPLRAHLRGGGEVVGETGAALGLVVQRVRVEQLRMSQQTTSSITSAWTEAQPAGPLCLCRLHSRRAVKLESQQRMDHLLTRSEHGLPTS